MAKATGKDHSQINLDIWGDEAFLDLSPAAQHLYFVLWTSPGLSYCGAGDWHPGRIAARAKGWTVTNVELAAAELSAAPEIYIIVDTDTGEYLLRSWIKHDGLCRSPNMAVSMANARADLASRTLRAVVVHEVAKVRVREPDLGGWKRDAVAKMLEQKSVDPADLPPYNPSVNPDANPSANPSFNLTVNPSPNPSVNGYGHPSVNPPANPGPTPAPTPAPISNSPIGGGQVRTEPQEALTAEPDLPPPLSRFCEDHPEGTDRACLACRKARLASDRADLAQREAQAEAERQAREEATSASIQAIVECGRCDDDGYIGLQVCAHKDHASAEIRAAARAKVAAAISKGSES